MKCGDIWLTRQLDHPKALIKSNHYDCECYKKVARLMNQEQQLMNQIDELLKIQQKNGCVFEQGFYQIVDTVHQVYEYLNDYGNNQTKISYLQLKSHNLDTYHKDQLYLELFIELSQDYYLDKKISTLVPEVIDQPLFSLTFTRAQKKKD